MTSGAIRPVKLEYVFTNSDLRTLILDILQVCMMSMILRMLLFNSTLKDSGRKEDSAAHVGYQ